MKTPTVTIVDYGVGNLYSVAQALQHVGANVSLVSTAEELLRADFLLLPGVGSFEAGMRGLRERGLVTPILEYVRTGKPFLGVCLGMQLMFEVSEEFGEHAGLGLIPGRVTAIPVVGRDQRPHKIPHIGWNKLIPPAARKGWEGTILQGLPPLVSTYFVHSYTAAPHNPAHRLADCDYDGCLISAAVQVDNVYGCQFHPEKSANPGLKILQNFIALK